MTIDTPSPGSPHTCRALGTLGSALWLLLASGHGTAHAQAVSPSAAPQTTPTPAQAAQAATQPPSSIWTRDTLTGDWGGLRVRLGDHGISFGLTEADEVFGSVAGGLRRGTIVEGKTEMDLGIDLDKFMGWQGGSFKASAYQIHGSGLSASHVGNILTVSNIEAQRGTRLADLYLEQKLFGGMVNIRAGQFAADEEFLTSDVAGVFLDATFGWPEIMAADLPNGGPAYPYSTPGIRVRLSPNDALSVQAAAFSGNPLGTNGNNGGIHFGVDGVLTIVEATYTTMPGKDDPGLGGNYKIGGWYNSLKFDDLHDDNTGQSRGSSASTGVPAQHTGNYGLYVSADHQLYRVQGTENGGLSGFVRLGYAPQENRNPIYMYADAGATWKGTFPGRDDDTVGLAFAWANVSHALHSLELVTNFSSGVSASIQTDEVVLELTYQASVTPWLKLQPDFQFVIHPGGASRPGASTEVLKNAALFGLRSTINF